jgi:hypothetical protein
MLVDRPHTLAHTHPHAHLHRRHSRPLHPQRSQSWPTMTRPRVASTAFARQRPMLQWLRAISATRGFTLSASASESKTSRTIHLFVSDPKARRQGHNKVSHARTRLRLAPHRSNLRWHARRLRSLCPSATHSPRLACQRRRRCHRCISCDGGGGGGGDDDDGDDDVDDRIKVSQQSKSQGHQIRTHTARHRLLDSVTCATPLEPHVADGRRCCKHRCNDGIERNVARRYHTGQWSNLRWRRSAY